MSALPSKADIIPHCIKCPLIAKSGHCLHKLRISVSVLPSRYYCGSMIESGPSLMIRGAGSSSQSRHGSAIDVLSCRDSPLNEFST